MTTRSSNDMSNDKTSIEELLLATVDNDRKEKSLEDQKQEEKARKSLAITYLTNADITIDPDFEIKMEAIDSRNAENDSILKKDPIFNTEINGEEAVVVLDTESWAGIAKNNYGSGIGIGIGQCGIAVMTKGGAVIDLSIDIEEIFGEPDPGRHGKSVDKEVYNSELGDYEDDLINIEETDEYE